MKNAKPIYSLTFALTMGIFLSALAPKLAHAQGGTTYINTNTTINSFVMTSYAFGASGQGGITNPVISIVSGANMNFNSVAYNTTTVNVTGGNTRLFLYDSSTLNISGGNVNILQANSSSTVNITGGLTGSPGAPLSIEGHNNALFNISGGTFGKDFYAYDGSIFNFVGTGLTATPNGSLGGFFRYDLAGNLSSGDSLTGRSVYVQSSSAANFNLNGISGLAAPEPTTLALLGLGLLGLGKSRKKQH
jgi:hypothetical protein